MGMKTINSLRTAFLASALVVLSGGCELDTVPDWGQACPPNGIVRGELSYFQMGSSARCQDGDGCFSEEFEYDVCPERYSRCNVDSEGKYYCMQKCPSGQIACDGLCIDDKANDAFCGAENTCSVAAITKRVVRGRRVSMASAKTRRVRSGRRGVPMASFMCARSMETRRSGWRRWRAKTIRVMPRIRDVRVNRRAISMARA